MGTCASPPVKKKSVVHERQVVDCQELRGKSLPKLTFHAVLSNLIIKDYPYPQVEPIFKLQKRQIALEPRHSEEMIKWKINEQFNFEMTELEMRENVVEVVLKSQGKKVGTIRINLFLIATGPFHQDFAIEYENGQSGRLSFDLRVSQVISLRIQCISAQISLLHSHPGEQFSFSIKTIAGVSGNSAQSDPSYPAMVLLQKKHEDQFEGMMLGRSKSEGMGAGISRRRSIRLKEIEMGRDLRWQGELPWLATTVLSSELHNTYFQVLMWRQQGTEDASHREFFADSYVSFYKLFGSEPSVTLKQGQPYESRNILITQKMQRYGKDCGRGTFAFNILNPPYFRQFNTCVHTEAGVLRTAPIFKQHDSDGQCPEIQQLLAAGETVEQGVFQLNRLQSEQADHLAVKKAKAIIEDQLEKIFHLLQRSASPQSFIYRYASACELLEGQKVLVELGLQVTKYLQIEDPTINDVCWLILISLIKRTEFSLSLMGLQQGQKQALQTGSTDDSLAEKLRIGSIYRVLMHKQLGLALGSLTRKGSDYERTFAQVFSAYAYFRIPEFRREVLRLITREDDPEINEWRGVEFNLHDDIPDQLPADGANVFSQLFDWEQHFYKWLPREQIQEEGGLGETLAQEPWRDRFTRRGLAFFYFLKYWVTYVQNALPSRKEIQWRYFPGYNRLLRGFFAEMKNRPLLQYPDALLDACLKLLVNEKLLNPLVKILLNKVNLYDTSAVRRAIEYLNIILQSLTDRRKALPINFNYGFLFKALRAILFSQFAMGVSAALVLLYDHFLMFHPDFRRSLSMFLLGSVFFKLFLHWSPTVRHVYYHLLTYRVFAQAYRHQRSPRDRKLPVTDTDILTRYEELMKRMQAAESQAERVSHIESSLEEHYFRKMKLKAYQRLRRGRLENSSMLNTKAESEDKNSEQERQQAIHSELKPPPLRRHPLVSEKHHSSEATLAARIVQNKENYTQEERNRGRPSEKDMLESPLSLFPNIIHEKEFQVQDIDAHQARFLTHYRPRFKEIETAFLQCLQSEDYRCPAIKIHMFIDNRQIRPQKIDEW